MGRISYDHICLGNLLHHPAGCHLTLQAFDPVFNLRITFCLFILIFYFLLCHTKLFFVFPALIQIIAKGNDRKGNTYTYQQIKDHFHHISRRCCRIHIDH